MLISDGGRQGSAETEWYNWKPIKKTSVRAVQNAEKAVQLVVAAT